MSPPELAQDLILNGVKLVGGGGMLAGFDQRLANETEVPVHLVDAPARVRRARRRSVHRGLRQPQGHVHGFEPVTGAGPNVRSRDRRPEPSSTRPATPSSTSGASSPPRSWPRWPALPDESVPALAALAHEVRLAWCGPEVEVEGILSAKTGGCPEDCHFCSQSAQFDTVVQATPFLDRDELLAAARETAAIGASEFCIVLAVRGPDEKTMQRLEELVPAVQEETGLNVAVSAGILTEEQAIRLAEVGTHRYNHNLETARSFFPQVVTTHSWEERFDTCRLVREHGHGAVLRRAARDGRDGGPAPRAARGAPRGRAGRGAAQLPQPAARARR